MVMGDINFAVFMMININTIIIIIMMIWRVINFKARVWLLVIKMLIK